MNFLLEQYETRGGGQCSEVSNVFQWVNALHQSPTGLLQWLETPDLIWDLVSMNFVVGLPPTQRKNNAIWVIVDRLTKTTHFIAIRNTWTLDELARDYLKEIVQLYSLLSSIVSEWDTKFQLGFRQKLQEEFRILLFFNTTFHSATDGQIKRTIQTLEDMLQTCVFDSKQAWDE